MPKSELRYGYAPVVDGKIIFPVKATLVEAWEAHPNWECAPVIRMQSWSTPPRTKRSDAWRPLEPGEDFKPKDKICPFVIPEKRNREIVSRIKMQK